MLRERRTSLLTTPNGRVSGFRPAGITLIADESERPRFERLGGRDALHVVAESGGKMLLTNQPR